MEISVYYATNRAHEGAERFRPERYGSRFSDDGLENLRFGRVGFSTDAARVQALLDQVRPHSGPGDGEALQDYFAECVAHTQRSLALPCAQSAAGCALRRGLPACPSRRRPVSRSRTRRPGASAPSRCGRAPRRARRRVRRG
jgi:hypothetical protein